MHQQNGTVAGIYITARSTDPMQSVSEVHAVVESGLDGDRHSGRRAYRGNKPGPDRDVTLIEQEAIDAAAREKGVSLDPSETRRNILTRGVRLNELVGREFSVGEVRLRGLRLCEPCSHLAGLTGRNVIPAFTHRGGLRAQVIAGGTIRVGDGISEA